MASEKDRLGEKLRDAERGREDAYFAEQDRKLLEKIRGAKTPVPAEALGHCPKCGTALRQNTINSVSVDECPDCQGMWLERGELEAIGHRESEGWIGRWLRLEFEKKR